MEKNPTFLQCACAMCKLHNGLLWPESQNFVLELYLDFKGDNMYKNTNCFHLAIPCGDLEMAKKYYSETLGCRLDNSAQEWADVDFWGNELTLHAAK